MDFSWSREEEEFRQGVRDFLKAELPAGWNDTLVLDHEDEEYIQLAKEFTQKLGAKGWFTAHWPKEPCCRSSPRRPNSHSHSAWFQKCSLQTGPLPWVQFAVPHWR